MSLVSSEKDTLYVELKLDFPITEFILSNFLRFQSFLLESRREGWKIQMLFLLENVVCAEFFKEAPRCQKFHGSNIEEAATPSNWQLKLYFSFLACWSLLLCLPSPAPGVEKAIWQAVIRVPEEQPWWWVLKLTRWGVREDKACVVQRGRTSEKIREESSAEKEKQMQTETIWSVLNMLQKPCGGFKEEYMERA